ncbi:AlpA family phage regulatory protein [Rhodoferax ferrireducens]|uniref:helix-turn-helix transcriptional regulator n=1 Tax=Rhodoferax ferrireducens TaxID=192843 RepID=UPI00298EA015|nr:AlpA family phage regulatory protein [Rhodoferax ferrireducens]WPC65266.1 AlpA family phage regulatory protein [Rhodoferax ferrireducens]
MQPDTVKRRQNRPQPQSLYAVQIADALLKIQTVICVTGLSESSIRRKVADGKFPQPVKDGKRCTRWVAGEVTNWLRAKVAA